LAAAIAAGALGAGLLLGAVGVVVAGDRTPGGMMGTDGAGLACDPSLMASYMASHMTVEQMNQMMGGSMHQVMGGMMGPGSGMGWGLHQQHHPAQP